MIKKTKKWLETSPVVWSVVLLMAWAMLSMWLMSAFNAYRNFQVNNQKVEMESLFDRLVLNSLSWEWIMTNVRIKRNIYVLKNWSSMIDVYAYREIFETNPWTNQVLSTPKIEFDRFYKIPLSDNWDLKIVFLPESKLGIDKVDKIW